MTYEQRATIVLCAFITLAVGLIFATLTDDEGPALIAAIGAFLTSLVIVACIA